MKEIYITENGCSSSDEPAQDGRVYDTDRVTYLRSYLTQLRRATAEGVPVRGYFLWSLMDNFEWADGYTNRFGIHYVDYATQRRKLIDPDRAAKAVDAVLLDLLSQPPREIGALRREHDARACLGLARRRSEEQGT